MVAFFSYELDVSDCKRLKVIVDPGLNVLVIFVTRFSAGLVISASLCMSPCRSDYLIFHVGSKVYSLYTFSLKQRASLGVAR